VFVTWSYSVLAILLALTIELIDLITLYKKLNIISFTNPKTMPTVGTQLVSTGEIRSIRNLLEEEQVPSSKSLLPKI